MSLGARILRNATFLTIGDKVAYLLQFVFFLYFAKEFGVVPTGEYSFAFSLTFAFWVFADLGISVYLVREVARKDFSDRQLFVDCLVLRAISTLTMSVIAIAIVMLFFTHFSVEKLRVIACWGGYWVFFSLADVFVAELNGREKMGRVALLGIWLKLISTVAGVLLIYLGVSYDLVLIAFPASGFVYLCSCILVSIRTLGKFRPKFRSWQHYKFLLAELFPFFSALILVEILWCQDILLLGILQNDRAVGIYSAALKITSFILGVSTFFYIAILPVLSKLFMESREKLIDLSGKLIRYLVLCTLPISFGLTITAEKIIDLLYSDSFKEATIVLQITSWIIAAGFIQAVFSAILTAINRQKEKAIFIGIIFVFSTLLNIFLIYHLNYIGAAIAKVATTVTALILFVYLVSKYLVFLPTVRYVIKPLVACGMMLLFVYYFFHLGLPVLIAMAALIYLISLVLLGCITQEEIMFIKNLFPRKIYSE